MSATIINAAPMVLLRGTRDRSTRAPVRVQEAIPQHLPKVYIYAKKGPRTPQLVVGDSLTGTYGEDSFDLRKKWANHATVMLTKINAEGNSCMVQRIIPDDAGPEANMLLSLDVLPTLIPQYQREIDGSFKVDTQGQRVPVSGGTTVAGFKVKWVVTTHTGLETISDPGYFGKATIGPGDQTDAVTVAQSQRYPVLQFKTSSVGAGGNDSGIRLYAPTANSVNGFNREVMSTAKTYPYRLSVIRRPDPISTARIVESEFGEQFINFGLKAAVIDPVADREFFLGKQFPSSYENIKDIRFPAVFGDFGSVAIYENNIDALLTMFYNAEKANSYVENDFSVTGTVDIEKHLFNFIGGTSSNGAPYNTFEFVTGGTGTVRLSEFSNIFARSGSDGTMNNVAFANSVTAEVMQYADPNSQLQDTAQHVESIIYDSGFPLATKKAMASFMAVRKDTFVVVGTHTAGQAPLTASEENSLAISLRTHYQLYPESDLFGTPAMRFMIMGRSGTLRNSQYTEETSSTIEVAIKSARYMGAGDGRWKTGFNFDGAPGSILENLSDINVSFTPSAVRNKDWDAGLNWIQRYDRTSFFFPALKTGYSDDSSVLNSYFTAMAICQINKVAESVWRDLSGVSGLSNGQIVDRANRLVTERCLNRFDGRYTIVPDAYFTDADIARGYSYTMPIKIYAAGLKTVMTAVIEAFRIEDLGT